MCSSDLELAESLQAAGLDITAIRGAAVARHGEVVAASWTSLVLDLPDHERLLRLALPEDVRADAQRVADVLGQIEVTIGLHRGPGAD